MRNVFFPNVLNYLDSVVDNPHEANLLLALAMANCTLRPVLLSVSGRVLLGPS